MRVFTTTGLCVPGKHYMVDVSSRVAQIRAMVERGYYFCINRPRQYGKTTTLAALETALNKEYVVVGLDFQVLSRADCATEAAFVRAFCRWVLRTCREVHPLIAERMRVIASDRGTAWIMDDLFDAVSDWCAQSVRPIVLIIDEVDSVTNNDVFLDFLARLRQQYLQRERGSGWPAFQSVVLAGVTDVKHLRMRIRPEKASSVNSPWNIAADFNVNMSFTETDVCGMLADYEVDHDTGMDITAVSHEVIAWTGGYPFLVSRLCQLMDMRGTWNSASVGEAARAMLVERNTLFESLVNKLETYPRLKASLRTVLMEGKRLAYNPDRDDIAQLEMYGFVCNSRGVVQVSNRLFETRLYNLFLSEDEMSDSRVYDAGDAGKSRFVREGRLNMRAVLEGFRVTWEEIFGPLNKESSFDEFDGRKQFLLYLKPIINGTGNYYIEAQTRDKTRTDVIVDYAGEQFVVELKIWRGPRYNEEGEAQLRGYLEHFGLDVGYMLSFNFNKRKEPGLKRVNVGNKVLWEEVL